MAGLWATANRLALRAAAHAGGGGGGGGGDGERGDSDEGGEGSAEEAEEAAAVGAGVGGRRWAGWEELEDGAVWAELDAADRRVQVG